jgi:hypothetical protein
MGTISQCPKDFEYGLGGTCRYRCPDKFKYLQEASGTGPTEEFCVSMYDNSVRIKLAPLPMPRPTLPESADYAAERDRVKAEAATRTAQLASQLPVSDLLQDVRAEMAGKAEAVTQIRSEYARYTERFEDPPTSVKDLVDTLKPLRPPTAPASDLATVRKDILASSAPNFLLIQVQLVLVILCLMVYAFLPLNYAPGISLLLLSVGVAVGIFLWK